MKTATHIVTAAFGSLLLWAFSGSTQAQSGTEASAEFEVASVRIAAHVTLQDAQRSFMKGGPGTDDPGHLTIQNMPLQALLLSAYGVKTYQIVGPSWLGDRRYDIVAKVPGGVTRAQMNSMLQSLLVTRFHMKIRRTVKDIAGYELVVADSGLKMKASSAAGEVSAPATNNGMITGKDGLPELPPGRVGLRSVQLPNGLTRITGRMLPMAIIVNVVENQTGKHVVDKTGLSDTFDVTLDFSRNAMRAINQETSVETGPDFFTALRRQLGLKLQPKDVPLDVLIIEQADKEPVEN